MTTSSNDTLVLPADAGYQRPRDPVETWLARQWQDVLGFSVGIRENFFGVGGNSLDAARVINAVLEEFGRQLPLNTLTERPTVEALATLLRGDAERLAGPLVAIQAGDGTRAPLFLVHGDDGQAEPFCRLAYALGEEATVYGLQAAGLHSGAEPARTVAAMADRYADAVRALGGPAPCLIGAGEVGAAVVHEMAVRLPGTRFVAAIGTELDPTDGGAARELTDAELPRLVPRILASRQARDLLPPDAAPEFAARSLRVWQAGRAAVRDWRPSPRTGSLHVIDRPELAGLPATVVQVPHRCGTDTRLADALQLLIG